MKRAAALRHDAGVSLLEVLAALAVVAVLTGTAAMYMGARPSEARSTADTLVTRLAEAREFALVSGEVIGFAADADQRGWRFFHAPDGRWQVMQDHPALEPVRLGQGMAIRVVEGALVRREAARAVDAPEILFDPTGFDQPFSYLLRADGERYQVLRDDRGGLQVSTDTQARAS